MESITEQNESIKESFDLKALNESLLNQKPAKLKTGKKTTEKAVTEKDLKRITNKIKSLNTKRKFPFNVVAVVPKGMKYNDKNGNEKISTADFFVYKLVSQKDGSPKLHKESNEQIKKSWYV